MAALTKRSTVYLDPTLHKALKLKALETSRSMSELINEAVRESIAEDADDFGKVVRLITVQIDPHLYSAEQGIGCSLDLFTTYESKIALWTVELPCSDRQKLLRGAHHCHPILRRHVSEKPQLQFT